MIVCVCHRVSDHDIIAHTQMGKGFDDLQSELGVATCCGRCEECVREVMQQCGARHAVAPHTAQVVVLR